MRYVWGHPDTPPSLVPKTPTVRLGLAHFECDELLDYNRTSTQVVTEVSEV